MLVRTYAFDVSTDNESVSINTLMNHLYDRSGQSDSSNGIERRIYVDSEVNGNYYVGLVVTVKDQKTFCRLEEKPEGVTITVENLREKNKLMEFNFFLLSKKMVWGYISIIISRVL